MLQLKGAKIPKNCKICNLFLAEKYYSNICAPYKSNHRLTEYFNAYDKLISVSINYNYYYVNFSLEHLSINKMHPYKIIPKLLANIKCNALNIYNNLKTIDVDTINKLLLLS